MKIHNKRELRNIATYHSADIDYKDFMNIYRTYTNKPCSFLTTSQKSFKIQKKLFRFITKITLTDELKIFDDKIKGNQAQYDSEREATKISAYHLKAWMNVNI